MKRALCLYGHLRTFRDCWESLTKNLLIPNSITDIFLTTWMESYGTFLHPESSNNPVTHIGYDPASISVDINDLTAVLNVLKPKGIHFDNYHLHDERFENMVRSLSAWQHPSIHHRPKGTLSQVWGRCATLKIKQNYEQKHNFLYDQVICTRWDIEYNQLIDLDLFDNNLITLDGMFGPSVISDAWACGPSTEMNKWGLQFNCIDDLVHKKTMSLGPHEWLKAHFDHQQILWSNRPDLIGITIRR